MTHINHEAARLKLLEAIREIRKAEEEMLKNHDEAKEKLLENHGDYVESK